VHAALTVRKLKPGTYDDWRKAWEPEEWPDFVKKAYVLRNINDPDEVIAFGFTDSTPEEIRASGSMDEEQAARAERMAQYVASTGADGFYEVVDVIEPGR
jgi:hypothetical protein